MINSNVTLPPPLPSCPKCSELILCIFADTMEFIFSGTVSFISNAWGGRTSDKFIIENCGFLDNIVPGDLILADRGFDIKDALGVINCRMEIPAFTKGKAQLSPLDVETTRKIASVRIHVERVIGVVRQKYSILSGTLPIDFLMTKPEDDKCLLDKIVFVCCALVNLCPSIINFD